jgi:lambda family phage portal protein
VGFLDTLRKIAYPGGVASEQPEGHQYGHRSVDEVKKIRYGSGKSKYGNIQYAEADDQDYAQLRANSRGAYEQSTIGRGIVTRLVDNVINTGLSRECAPMWDLIPNGPQTEQEQYRWEREIESRWKLYAQSTEADLSGRQSLKQLMRLLYRIRVVEGEYFVILRYLNAADRMSPLAIQIVPNDAVQTPYDGVTTRRVEDRGGSIEHGIEYDRAGKAIAIYVKESHGDEPTRVPFFGPRSGRRFVIHDGNFESADQFRGFPELAGMVYELDRLTEYDISELEAVVASALWMGVVEAESDASPGKGPGLKPRQPKTDTPEGKEVEKGIEQVQIGKRALVMNNLQPGYHFKGFQPSRPNPNYQAFVEAFETRLAGMLGMPLSVLRQKFQSSYSAARAEILFFWNNVYRRRDDFATGFLDPLFEAWLSEEVRAAKVSAPGFENPITRKAWLWGSWNGISRPVVDPLKEANAVGKRLEMGHTTGEKEAKTHNGSDFQENARRLARENELLSEANAPLEPEPEVESEPASDEGDEEGND